MALISIHDPFVEFSLCTVFYRNMRWFNQPISQYLPTQQSSEATIYSDLKPLTNRDMKKP